jgi:hypothetical protein
MSKNIIIVPDDGISKRTSNPDCYALSSEPFRMYHIVMVLIVVNSIHMSGYMIRKYIQIVCPALVYLVFCTSDVNVQHFKYYIFTNYF